MSKVITFAKEFPAYHPDAGKPTFFYQKFMTALFFLGQISYGQAKSLKLFDFDDRPIYYPKYTTIRKGKRFKSGEAFSPRQWSARPYASKQEVLSSPVLIKSTYDFTFLKNDGFYINGVKINIEKSFIPLNDGLTARQLYWWFSRSDVFDGQIISIKDDLHKDEIYKATELVGVLPFCE